ncbi:MAG: NAD-dependent epimerase/dehydratase family protein, partial [Candidatus Rokuibacteriota bacterium]
MRVFLSGGTGFIGSHLARRLAGEGCEVGLLTRPGADLRRVADLLERVSPIRGDLLDPAAVREGVARFQPEVAVHLAWYTVPGRYWEAPENLAYLAASLTLVQALDEAGCRRLVLVGTGAEYDPDAGGHYADDSPIRPRTLYAACKPALWLAAERFAASRGRTAAVARLFQVYGPGEPDARLVPGVIRSLLAGRPCRLTAGTHRRDFIHVEDAASALAAVARASLDGPVNVGTSTAVPVAEV